MSAQVLSTYRDHHDLCEPLRRWDLPENVMRDEKAAFREKVTTEGMDLIRSCTVALSIEHHFQHKHLGTAILFRISDVRFLFTAAHVIDHVSANKAYITAPNGGQFDLTMKAMSSTVPEGGTRDDDYLDFSVCEIVHCPTGSFDGLSFLQLRHLDRNDDQHPSSVYLVYGYPFDSLDLVNKQYHAMFLWMQESMEASLKSG